MTHRKKIASRVLRPLYSQNDVFRWREENNRNDGSRILEDMVDYMQVAFQVIKIMMVMMMIRSETTTSMIMVKEISIMLVSGDRVLN